jgi:hypothetical protein
MEMESKPCQDQFLNPILVLCRKIRKIQVAKWGIQKNYFKKMAFIEANASDNDCKTNLIQN